MTSEFGIWNTSLLSCDTLMVEATQQGFDFPCLITARLLSPVPALPRDVAARVENRAGPGWAAQALLGLEKLTLIPAWPRPGFAEKGAAPELVYWQCPVQKGLEVELGGTKCFIKDVLPAGGDLLHLPISGPPSTGVGP